MPYHANFYGFRCFTNYNLQYQPTWTSDCDFFSSISVDVHERETLFTIYPNPTDDVLHLKISKEIQNAGIEITDLQGRKVHCQIIDNSKDAQMSVQHLRSGMYVLRVVDAQGQVLYQEKWLKQ
ncbi:MAG: T9SS type A sorting domain-containing protein [Cryomorphaceae bacterium]|nr:T9SS type A sorting domain-containing protein [Cryomorphaceae bacterium]